MWRNNLIIFFLIVLSSVFIQGKFINHSIIYQNQTSYDISDLWKQKLIDSLGIPEPALNLALNGYYHLKSDGLLKNDSLITIIDFSSPSTAQRFFVLDIKNQRIVRNTWVAHGMNSGVNLAEDFSNNKHSNKSSLGLYLTAETYDGNHGYSLRLDGMSEDLNDNARKRTIVIHGADYVSDSFIKSHGRLGRSFGCPALPVDEVTEIIDLIKGGSCLFIYHPSIISISQEDLEKLP